MDDGRQNYMTNKVSEAFPETWMTHVLCSRWQAIFKNQCFGIKMFLPFVQCLYSNRKMWVDWSEPETYYLAGLLNMFFFSRQAWGTWRKTKRPTRILISGLRVLQCVPDQNPSPRPPPNLPRPPPRPARCPLFWSWRERNGEWYVTGLLPLISHYLTIWIQAKAKLISVILYFWKLEHGLKKEEATSARVLFVLLLVGMTLFGFVYAAGGEDVQHESFTQNYFSSNSFYSLLFYNNSNVSSCVKLMLSH